MAWKWFKNDWNIAGFLLFWAQFAWAIYFISLVLYSIIFIIEIFAGGFPGIFDLPARIYIQDYSELIAISEAEKIFQDPILETDFNPIGEDLDGSWSYYLAAAMIVGLDGIILYGLTLLRRILRSLRRQDPWTDQNSTNLKTIGYLMLLAVPYQYAIGWLSYLTVQQVQLPESVSLFWPPFPWEIGLAGLAVILVAYIFEEGTRLYEEQKLTV